MNLFDRAVLTANLFFIVRALNMTVHSHETIVGVQDDGSLPFLSIVVPARNEAHQIERCVRSLLAQRYADFEVIVVDDCSTDATRAILDGLAAHDARLRVLGGEPLPAGWVGKPWALAQGAQAARGTWLLFTDADTLHEPLAAASVMTHARRRGVQAVSLLTTQEFRTLGERALLPTILCMIGLGIGSLDAINDPRRSDIAIFNGQYILIERSAYEQLGGHTAVRSCIAEDYEFARLFKRDGRFRSLLAGGNDLVRTRMYRSAAGVWNGFSKNLYVAVAGHPLQFAAAAFLLASLSPLPELMLVHAVRRKKYGNAATYALAITATAAVAEFAMRRSRFPKGSGGFFPIGAAAMLSILANSALRHRSGRVTWKGRRYRDV